jgi:hypothetical protein
MANDKANYDKTALTIAALLALGVAGYIYTLKGSFSEKLETTKVTPQAKFAEVPIDALSKTLGNLQTVFNWVPPLVSGKPVPLNKSIAVILRENDMVDIYVEEPKLRPPMTNKFLREHDLEYLSPNVGDLDPDGDSFTNLEEFNKNTNPKDKASHPPLTDKLYLKERVEKKYVMALNNADPPFIVRRSEPLPAASAMPFIQPPFPIDFGFERGAAPRFTATNFEKKESLDKKDISELSVKDKVTGTEFKLVYRQPFSLSEYSATLEFRIGQVQTFTVKKGDNFRINGIAATYNLVDITEDGASVAELGPDNKPKTPFPVAKKP